jgi:Uma2 family endonuclease
MAVSVARRVFTVSEYERMGGAGILGEDDHVELIEGEIITMSPIGGRHAACVKRLNRLLSAALGQAVIVSVQDPIRLGEFSEPQPDVALLRPRADFYTEHPTPTDVLFVLEVAETSLAYDRDVKLPLYARAGIPEAWLVDLAAETIWQYTRPENGAYQEARQWRRGQSVTLSLPPELTLNVEQILG